MLQLKEPLGVPHRKFAKILKRDPPLCGETFCRVNQIGRFIPAGAMRMRGEIGAIGLDQHAVDGHVGTIAVKLFAIKLYDL